MLKYLGYRLKATVLAPSGRSLTIALLCLLLILLTSFGGGSSAWAADSPVLLTPELLQQRLDHPIQREGKPTLDLRRLVIDLRPENGDFRDRFYRQVRRMLQSGNTAITLDLSNSRIQGEFDLRQLSLREPLYGEALFPLLTEAEQTQLKRDRRRLSQLSQLSRSLLLQPQASTQGIFLFRGPLILAQTRFEGPVNGADIFFLGPVNGSGVRFTQGAAFTESRFSQPVTFTASQWQGNTRFRNSLFFDRVRFTQASFVGPVTFQGSEFGATAGFAQVQFCTEASFSRVQFQGNADFAKTTWQGSGSFVKTSFDGELFLTEARLEASLSLRQARFSHLVNLRGATVLRRVDFGDGVFLPGVHINGAAMEFNADEGEILGSPGQIGQVLSVPNLVGNETLLRNWVRNFRKLEQIADANQVEYTTERLRLEVLQKQLTAVNLNTASASRLMDLGFNAEQAAAILHQRQKALFLRAQDVLNLEEVDLAAYVKMRDRIVALPARPWGARLALALRWLGLAALLLTSNYGTSVGLILGVGMVAVTVSTLLFWTMDRYRRRIPTPICPPPREVAWMGISGLGLGGAGVLTVVRLGDWPGLTLVAIALVVLPIPLALIAALYRQGRYHDLLDSSYLMEDGSARQLRLLIARLPILPSFAFFRERYVPIPWDRRRTWLYYYDFSLNNWFKFGFNDLRLRDEQVPGLVTALVWYQWAVGLLYVTLLLWTFSRTIPGLNLLLYF